MVPSPDRNRFARTTLRITVSLLLLAGSINADQDGQAPDNGLKRLSLEELGNIEVTTSFKQPVKITRTPGAIYVITQEDIRRSGAANIHEALRLAPGLRLRVSTAASGPSAYADLEAG